MVDHWSPNRTALGVTHRRLAAHPDLDFVLVEPTPAFTIAVQTRIRRVDLLPIQVAGGGGVVGDTPGDVAVGAPPQSGHTRMARAGRVVLRSVQPVLVPARWDPEGLMGVAAQQRLSRGRTCGGHGPVVATGA